MNTGNCLKLLLGCIFCFYLPFEELTAQTVEISKAVTTNSVPTGQTFSYLINYNCNSTTDSCENVVITDLLPEELEYRAASGGTHPTTITTTVIGDNTEVTFTFDEPIGPGATSQLQIDVRFPYGTSPDNITVDNTANVTSSNAGSLNSNTVEVTSEAELKAYINKTIVGGDAAIDCPVTYRIQICQPASTVSNHEGQFNFNDITLEDVLPTNAQFVSASDGGTHDSGVVTWTGLDANINVSLGSATCTSRYVTVQFPNGTFSEGDAISNTANATGTVPGGATEILTTTLNSNLSALTSNIQITTASGSGIAVGEIEDFSHSFVNSSNQDLDNFEVSASIPLMLELTSFRIPANYYADDFSISVFYQTNLNATWQGLAGNPYLTYEDVEVSGLGLAANEYITEVRYEYGTVIKGAGYFGKTFLPQVYGILINPDQNGNPVNVGDSFDFVWDYQYEGACDMVVHNRSKTTSWNVTNPFAVPRASIKEVINPATDNSYGAYNIPTYIVGDTVEYQASFDNLSNALIPLDNPDAVDVLPVGLELIPNSFTWVTQLPGMPNPIETVTENFNGGENTAIRWSWKGASAYSIHPGDSWAFRFKVRVTIETAASQIRNRMRLCCWDNADVVISSNSCTDGFDINQDGDTTDRISCSNSSYGRFNNTAIAGLESAKWVKGQGGLPNENNVNANPCQDIENGFTRYPCNAVTVPGGIADYKLFVWNPGNVPMTDVVVIDILPHIGDTEVLEENIPRNTEWSPILVGAVTPPSGVTVYYSTETNPCRPEVLSPDPAACQAPNWSITPPSDITQVKSLKFDFGSLVINPADTLELNWPMRTPTDAPNNGEIAWNSFAYAANRADNNQALLPSEPIKVGITTMPVNPAVYGDFVWLDTNMNGIQDFGETGISGVRVELYQDNGDKIPDPSTDLFVNFTMTGDDGRYLFPNLPSGDYYAVFSPPSGYTISPSLQGNDSTLDSEGLIAAVTTLGILEDDHSWDLGIFPSSDCGVTITNYTVSDCEFDDNTNNSSYDVNVFVNWSNEPIGELIEVNIDGNIQTIDPTVVSAPTMLTFTLTADGSSQSITANFETTIICSDNKNYTAPLPCDPAICAIGITQYAQSNCRDNETNDDDSDDYFTLTLNVTSENGGAQYEVVINANLDGTGGTVLGTANYNSQIIVGGGANGARGTFDADGTTTYIITIRDVNDSDCFETITTQTVDSCNSPCTKCGRVSVVRN